MPDDLQLIIRQAIVSEVDFASVCSQLRDGLVDLRGIFGPETPQAPIILFRQTLQAALGHAVVPTVSYATAFGSSTSIPVNDEPTRRALTELVTELGLPFTSSYADHFGSFEIFCVQDEMGASKSFLFEAIPPKNQTTDKGPCEFQICRDSKIERMRHFASIALRSNGDLIMLESAEFSPTPCRLVTSARSRRATVR